MSSNISDMNAFSKRPLVIPPSGLVKIEYIDYYDVESVVIKYPDTTLIDIIPKPGKAWVNLYFTPRSVKIRHTPIDTPAGEIHYYNIEHHIPANRIEASMTLIDLSERSFFLKLTFANGNVRIFGEPDNGVKYKVVEQLAPAQISPDGYDFNWYGSFSHPAFFDYTTHQNEVPGNEPQFPASGSPSLSGS